MAGMHRWAALAGGAVQAAVCTCESRLLHLEQRVLTHSLICDYHLHCCLNEVYLIQPCRSSCVYIQ